MGKIRSRKQLDARLREICPNVYFQPPRSYKLKYPCIVFNYNSGDTQFASNFPYIIKRRYQIVAIYKDPDNVIPKEISKIQGCTFDRDYDSDNLYHTSFNIYI